ncbi:Ribosomal L27 domain containing protein, partial [Rhypophila sp. PSN 637]
MPLLQLRRPLQRAAVAATTSTSFGLLSESLAALRIDANAAVQGRRYASVKSQGAYRLKPKNPIPKKLGAKKTGDQFVLPGNIIYKQRGTIWHAGENTILGRDHTIHAAVTGYVKYYRDPQRHPKRQYIGVVFDKEDKLPYPPGMPRKRKLGMIAQRIAPEPAPKENIGPSGIPLTVTRVTEIEPEAADSEKTASRPTATLPSTTLALPKKELTGGSVVIAALIKEKLAARRAHNAAARQKRLEKEAELRQRQATRIFRLQKDYSYRETNWEIGRLVGDPGVVQGTEKVGSRKAKLRYKRKRDNKKLLTIKMNALARAARREEYLGRVKAKR